MQIFEIETLLQSVNYRWMSYDSSAGYPMKTTWNR